MVDSKLPLKPIDGDLPLWDRQDQAPKECRRGVARGPRVGKRNAQHRLWRLDHHPGVVHEDVQRSAPDSIPEGSRPLLGGPLRDRSATGWLLVWSTRVLAPRPSLNLR